MASYHSDRGEMSYKFKTGSEMNNFFSLPVSHDKKTEMYVKFAKVLLIFQGPDFSARTRAVDQIKNVYKHSCYVISDETYKKSTGNKFDPERTEDFYTFCQKEAKKAFETGSNLIVIDQSMTTVQQTRYFLYFAQQMQYLVLVVPPVVEGGKILEPFNPEEKKYLNQAQSFRPLKANIDCPNLFKHFLCGWYMHDVDSAELRDLGDLYLQDCFENILEFRKLFSKVCSVESFKSYYNMSDMRQNLACCILKIFKGVFGDHSYFTKESVIKFYGKMSKLYIVGFIVSPNIIAARVKLTREQMDLWELPDDLSEDSEIVMFPSEKQKMAKIVMEDCDIKLICSKSNRTIITGKPISEPTQAISPMSRARSCHIVLGKSNRADARNIDYDVPFAVHRQRKLILKQEVDLTDADDIGRALVQRCGKYWFIYLKDTIIVDGFLATGSMAESYDNLV